MPAPLESGGCQRPKLRYSTLNIFANYVEQGCEAVAIDNVKILGGPYERCNAIETPHIGIDTVEMPHLVEAKHRLSPTEGRR